MSSWQTVKSRSEDKKKRLDERKKTEVKKDRLGVAVEVDPVLAAFDRAYSKQQQAQQEERQSRGAYVGTFAGLEDETPIAARKAGGGNSSDGGGDSSDDGAPRAAAAANGNGAHAAGAGSAAEAKKKAVKPKVKKPKVTVATVAQGIDVDALQELFTQLRSRYPASQASQLGVLADQLLKAFSTAHLEFNKALAEKPLAKVADLPIRDVPQPVQDALRGFVDGCNAEALAEVLPNLVVASFEGLPDGAKAEPAPKNLIGLLVLLSVMLRARPGALVAAAPALLAAGRTLTAPARLPQLLWVLQQAAAAEPAFAVAAWSRLLLPQLLGAAELPPLPSKPKPAAPAAKGAAPAPQAPVLLDAPSAELALNYLQSLLDSLTASSPADVAVGPSRDEPVVPGAAVELVSRLAFVEDGGGSKRGGGAAAAARLRALHAGLAALAGAGAERLPGAADEWLLLALESAGGSGSAPDAPDELVLRSAAAVVSCLAASDGSAQLWEAKHKQQLRGSARVLAALAARPALLAPLQRAGKVPQLRELAAALRPRHATMLASGKGWQGACARVADGACATLRRAKGGRARGAGGSVAPANGAGSAAAAALGAALTVAGVLATAAVYRREVGGVMTHYAGPEAARQLDELVLAPLNGLLAQAAAAAAPHVAAARQAAAPYARQLADAAAPHVAAARDAATPLLAAAQAKVAPVLAQAQAAAADLLHQAQEIWQRAKEG